MRAVLKYHFAIADEVIVPLPEGANILHVDTQRGRPVLWADVDTDNPNNDRRLYIVGTGKPITFSDTAWYVGTFFEGPFVWHVYESE